MEILIIIILILFNGFFALSEIALVSSRKSRLESMKANGSTGAAAALKLLEKSENFLSAVQVGITLVGIVTGAFGGIAIAEKVSPVFVSMGIAPETAYQAALIITIILITYLSIVIGELVPKTIALSNPESVAVKVAPVIKIFTTTFYPFVRFLSISTSFINSVLGIKKQESGMTEAELKQMLRTASNEGVIGTEQNRMHEKVFYFAEKKARHIMTHRHDVEWIDLEMLPEEQQKEIISARHSQLLVCRGDIDNFLGFLNVKEFLIKKLVAKSIKPEDMVTDPIIFPEAASAKTVLKTMKDKKINIAVVVDEYGSFQGVLTLHDMMENLLGEMPDKEDLMEPMIIRRDENSYLVSGIAPVETLAEVLGDFEIDFDKIDYSTVAGFVLAKIMGMPQTGDRFNYGNYLIEIVDMDGSKIDKLLITKVS
ncbi:MAG TPA: hemolysin family protein [Lentimicrobium sp.]|nr:hemolysin family protein [Lentimicrobium sp.]